MRILANTRCHRADGAFSNSELYALLARKKLTAPRKDLHFGLQNGLFRAADLAYRVRMTSEMLESIRQSGAEARVAGLSQQENPFYAIAALPWATGETTVEWQVKASAWTEGWVGTDTR